MSTKYQSSRDVPAGALADRLSELADVVISQKRDRIDAELTMRIPAECDRDADLVLAEASRRLLEMPAVQAEPVAYAVFAENGNIRIWCSDPIQAETLRQQYGDQLKPLYAAPQPAEQQPDVVQLVEALERVMYCNEVGFLPESVQQAVSAALAAHCKRVGDV